MYGGDSAAALPDTVVRPPVPAEGDTAAPASVVTGAGVGPLALGIGGKPHPVLSCSTFCSQYVLPALPKHAAHGHGMRQHQAGTLLVRRMRAPSWALTQTPLVCHVDAQVLIRQAVCAVDTTNE